MEVKSANVAFVTLKDRHWPGIVGACVRMQLAQLMKLHRFLYFHIHVDS